MNGWWYRASQPQKLAQIDGGIQLGMTAKQVAMLSGVAGDHAHAIVNNFALRHGRSFPDAQRGRVLAGAAHAKYGATRARNAYFGGAGNEALWMDDPRAFPSSGVEEVVLE